MRPEAGNPEILFKVMDSASASIAPFKVSAPVAKVTSPAEVVFRNGVMS